MNRILSLFSLLFSLSLTAAEPPRPNILFLAIDDLRPELGCYGDTVVKSPHLDQLAQEGILFERAYCQVAVCGASRASMMTGILPTATRYVDYLTTIDADTPGAITLAQHFQDHGYTTLANGKILHTASDASQRSWSRPVQYPKISHQTHLDPASINSGDQKGKKRFFESPEVEDTAYTDGLTAENTIADLRRLKKKGGPFFLGCGFIRPHLPFYAPKKYWDLYDEKTLPLAPNRYRPKDYPKELNSSREFKTYDLAGFDPSSEAFHRKMRHGYFASTSYVDTLVGKVLAELKDLGLDQNTIVVVWGDHGWHLGEHTFWGKHNTLHNATRVPLIVRVPGKPAGLRTQALVQSVDLFPTLCALAGLDTPPSVQGQSFAKLLDNPAASHQTAVYNRFKKADALITNRYSYSRFESGAEMLFDLREDPEENSNLASDEKLHPTLLTLRQQLDASIEKAESATW
ncbi:sulfatase [Roseibacillus persicicus]|uniref:sulfatase n=1 Tax=Roseibacillus persicicus TaxID=454148 RepID=UPI00398AEA1C